MEEPADVLSLLAQRTQLVQRLSDGNTSLPSLTQTLPVSRSTVSRALNTLETAQLVQRNGNGYELTHYGRFAYQTYRRVTDRYETLTAAQPLFAHLPATTAIPAVVFDEATVIRPSPPTPHEPRTRFADRVRQGEEIVGVVPIVSQRDVELFYDQLTTHNLRLSLLLDEQTTAYLRDAHNDGLNTVVESDRCTLWSSEQTPPFSLTIIDWTELWLGVNNECGQLQGMVQTDSTAAVEWAEQFLHLHIEQATPVCRQNSVAAGSKEHQSS